MDAEKIKAYRQHDVKLVDFVRNFDLFRNVGLRVTSDNPDMGVVVARADKDTNPELEKMFGKFQRYLFLAPYYYQFDLDISFDKTKKNSGNFLHFGFSKGRGRFDITDSTETYGIATASYHIYSSREDFNENAPDSVKNLLNSGKIVALDRLQLS